MRKFLSSIFILATLLIFPISSEAATQAQIDFYDFESLTKQEQEAIIREKPALSQEFSQYHFIYKKILATQETNDRTDSSKLVLSEGKDTSKIKSSPTQLPKAGEISHSLWVLIGSGGVVSSIFILYRRRKYSKLLLIILIPTALGTSTVTAFAQGDPLIPSENIALSDSGQAIVEPRVIEGYQYVGYYPVVEPTSPVQKSQVTVLYLDENANEIHEPKTVIGNVGEKYDVSIESYKLSISGYQLNENKLPENATGVFENQSQTVIYAYQKEVNQKGKVTIQYVDKNDNEIAPSEALTGEIGQDFHVEKKEIPNFLYENADGMLDGAFKAEEQHITLYYTDEMNINIHYVDKWKQQPLILDTLQPFVELLRPQINDIDDYYFTNSYNGKSYGQGMAPEVDQITAKIGTTYVLPKEIRFSITKPNGETMSSLSFPKAIEMPDGTWIAAVDSYSNFLFFQEKPEYIPENYTGVADQLEIDVTYEVTSILTMIPIF